MLGLALFAALVLAAASAPEDKYGLIAFGSENKDLDLHFLELVHHSDNTHLGISADVATNFVVDSRNGYLRSYDVAPVNFLVEGIHGLLRTSDYQYFLRKGNKLVTDGIRASTGFTVEKASGALVLGGRKDFVACPIEGRQGYTIEITRGKLKCYNGVDIELRYVKLH